MKGLVGAQAPPMDVSAVSVITEIELLGSPGLSREEYDSIRQLLADIPIIIRRGHRLELADAIIVATAQVLGASLISNDSQLDRVPSIDRIELKLLGG